MYYIFDLSVLSAYNIQQLAKQRKGYKQQLREFIILKKILFLPPESLPPFENNVSPIGYVCLRGAHNFSLRFYSMHWGK